MPSATLNCPSCGAAISSDSTRCEHCGSRLATVACPSCFGLAFVGSKFCPHCGKELVVPQELEAGLHCPRCRTATLQQVTLKDTNLLECQNCFGLWLPIATFEHICNGQEQQAAVLAMNLPRPPQSSIGSARAYLPCPECGNLMNRKDFAHRSGIIFDVCLRHGVWFDRDELRHIIEFIRDGGLDRARAIEKEQLHDEVRTLEGLETRISPTSVFNDVHEGELANALTVAAGWLSRFRK
jgi:Zn-finger nucleic acid-binding protein